MTLSAHTEPSHTFVQLGLKAGYKGSAYFELWSTEQAWVWAHRCGGSQ